MTTFTIRNKFNDDNDNDNDYKNFYSNFNYSIN